MGTKIIVEGRRSGKTTRAIEESARTGIHILAPHRDMARFIFQQAKDAGIDIPFPITLDEWMQGRVRGYVRMPGLIIDEGLILLEKILRTHIHMITISEREETDSIVDAEENEKMNRDEFDAARYEWERKPHRWIK